MCVLAALLFLAPLVCPSAAAQAVVAPLQHPTIVFFSDQPLSDDQWTALIAALHTLLAKGGAEVQALDSDADFVRGTQVRPGIQVASAITVYLHGDCKLRPARLRTAYGASLGWVWRDGGHIEPFAHVDCTQIANVLGPQANWLSVPGRVQVMAGAIARVVLHEWIHIATQSSAHSAHGLEKAQFGVTDLMESARLGSWSHGGR
jgi:hypothetical protein